jgi:hypothetical protein
MHPTADPAGARRKESTTRPIQPSADELNIRTLKTTPRTLATAKCRPRLPAEIVSLAPAAVSSNNSTAGCAIRGDQALRGSRARGLRWVLVAVDEYMYTCGVEIDLIWLLNSCRCENLHWTGACD